MRLFGNTVDRITSSLTSMVKELEAHGEAMHAKAEKHHQRVRAEELKAAAAVAEAIKATKVSAKIGELLK